ncbi:RNA-binding (RRM/RBD/RNP motifs) family protein [Thalictrum thalictroides]|uniref:RNA-binding (RRM/RBD/RNP motifs) family protein n=1 Tax=Thalictrum thalictroides TaxID=46969 RepID=A0A7J6VZD9_THATH|nr:RNA-binding (RRM/RBD/RNP motifs) family protein [Thalictrum thalictroides]
MTVDDEKSVYVGGIPYDCNEDMIRKAFDPYGQIVAVKIVNDNDIGGKCYGFVTFLNPRSAVDAIIEMNGKKIGGRVVKVNEVKTRGGRPHFNRGNSFRDTERNLDWDRDRNRERDHDHDRDHHRDRHRRSRDREWEWEREYDHPRGYDRSKDRFVDETNDRDQNQDVEREGGEQEWGRKRDQNLGRDLDRDRDREVDRYHNHIRRENDKDKDQQSKSRISSRFSDRQSRELSSNSSDDYQDQVKEQVELSVQNHANLQQEISQIQERLDERERYVLDLQKKSQKLEDALAVAKKISSQKRTQLNKFQRCIQQVNEYTEKLKSSELELQSLVDAIMVEADDVEVAGSVYIYGKA